MARIRSIKPNFFRSRSVKALNSDEKLVWIGLWSAADDEGRLIDEVGILVGDLWALSLSAAKLDRILLQLHTAGRIIRYEMAGHAYIQVTNWTEHQRISNPTPSVIPPVPFTNESVSVPDSFVREGRGRERKGGEAPPSPHCGKHPTGTDKPCRPCGDARRRFEAWKETEKRKPSPKTTMVRPSECDHPKGFDEHGYCQRCGAKK